MYPNRFRLPRLTFSKQLFFSSIAMSTENRVHFGRMNDSDCEGIDNAVYLLRKLHVGQMDTQFAIEPRMETNP